MSKDTDFYQRSLVSGIPPKVILLRVGNSSTSRIAALIRQRFSTISAFHEDAETAFLVLRSES